MAATVEKFPKFGYLDWTLPANWHGSFRVMSKKLPTTLKVIYFWLVSKKNVASPVEKESFRQAVLSITPMNFVCTEQISSEKKNLNYFSKSLKIGRSCLSSKKITQPIFSIEIKKSGFGWKFSRKVKPFQKRSKNFFWGMIIFCVKQ